MGCFLEVETRVFGKIRIRDGAAKRREIQINVSQHRLERSSPARERALNAVAKQRDYFDGQEEPRQIDRGIDRTTTGLEGNREIREPAERDSLVRRNANVPIGVQATVAMVIGGEFGWHDLLA